MRPLHRWSRGEGLLRFHAGAAARGCAQVHAAYVVRSLLALGVIEHDCVPGLAFRESGSRNLRLADEARARAPVHTARHDVDHGDVRVSRERPQRTGNRGAEREPRKHGAGYERRPAACAR